MEKSIIDDNKRALFIELLKTIQKNTFEPSKHRELAAWAIAVFYITLLGISYKYIHQSCLTIASKYVYLGLIIILYFVVTGFIHAQYAIYDLLRKEYAAVTGLLFEVITGKFDFDYEEANWEIKDPNIYPNFIQERIEKVEKIHTYKKINPFVIIYWFCMSLIALIFKTEHPKNPKINLIESSLYCFLFIPTVIVLIFLVMETLYVYWILSALIGLIVFVLFVVAVINIVNIRQNIQSIQRMMKGKEIK